MTFLGNFGNCVTDIDGHSVQYFAQVLKITKNCFKIRYYSMSCSEI